jgi:hypothetical protein
VDRQQRIDDQYQVLRPMELGPKVDPSKEHAYWDRPAVIMPFSVHGRMSRAHSRVKEHC